jgi:hypothetical protein
MDTKRRKKRRIFLHGRFSQKAEASRQGQHLPGGWRDLKEGYCAIVKLLRIYLPTF